jgi:hypothetical protein
MFKKLLKRNDFDYCIVGNSPCEVGQKNGEKIDSHKLIFRFNDFSLDQGFQEDYGSKVNIWIRGTNDKLVYTMEQKKELLEDLDLIILRAKDDRNKKFRDYCKTNGIKYYVLPLENELELTKDLGRCPSTGLLLLYSIKKVTGGLDRSRVYGFSFCRENRSKRKTGGQIHYYNKDDLVNPVTGKVESIKNTFLISKHDWGREEIYFRNKILRG